MMLMGGVGVGRGHVKGRVFNRRAGGNELDAALR